MVETRRTYLPAAGLFPLGACERLTPGTLPWRIALSDDLLRRIRLQHTPTVHLDFPQMRSPSPIATSGVR
jgi:hypothetical protein